MKELQPNGSDDNLKDSLGAKTISPTGKPPRRKYSDAQDINSIVSNLINANQQRDRVYAAWKGMIDGNPPYSTEALRNAGEAHRANFNTMEARAKLGTAIVPFWDLFAGGKYLVEVICENGSEDEAKAKSNLITRLVNQTLREDPDFKPTMCPMLRDYLAFGKGFLTPQGPEEWHYDHVPFNRVLVPDGTALKPSKLELIVVRQDVPVHMLYDWMQEDDENSQHWNKESCWKTMRNAVKDSYRASTEGMDIQREMNSHELFDLYACEKLHLANVYVREYDKKWTHFIIEENFYSQDFLYSNFSRYDAVHEFLVPFFLEMVDDNWHELFGMCRTMYQPMKIKDRLTCATVDGGFVRASVVLQPKTENAMEKTGLIQLGGAFTFIPPGFEALNSQIMGDIESTQEVNRSLDQIVSKVTNTYDPQLQRQKGNPETATHEQLNFSMATSITNMGVTNFYDQVDLYYGQWWPRFKSSMEQSGPAGKCWDRLKKKGITKDDLEETYVRAFRNMGNGSMMLRLQAMGQMLAMFPHFPEDGKKRFIADFVALASGQVELVERYVETQAAMGLPTDHQAWAMVENGIIKAGGPVTWTPSQNDIIHAQTHLQAGAEAAAQVQQGADPREVLAFITGIGKHLPAHFEALSKDPSRKDALKALVEQWKQLAQVADQLKEHIAQQQKANQQRQQAQRIQQGVDPATQIQAATAQAKMRLQRAKTIEQMRLKRESHRQQMEMASQDMALKDASTAAEIERKRYAAFSTAE